MTHRSRGAARRSFAALFTGALLALHPLAQAQLPGGDKPIRIVVPLTAGSTVDTLARAMAPQFAKASGHPVVVENVVGAGGVSGTQQVVRAAKDGLTLGMVSSNHAINPSIYKTMPFDSLKDITPISVIGTVPVVLVANPALPAKDLKELIAYAKANPGKLDYGSAGNGSVLHLAGELLKSEAGIFLTHIPYRGTGPLITDLVGGQVQLAFLSVTAAAPHVKAGKLRALGVSTPQRSAVMPEVPTLAEAGLPKYSFDAWIALVGPAGLPRTIVEQLHADVKATLAHKEVQDAMAAQGIAPIGSAPAEAEAFFKSELDKHARLVKLSGATMN